MDSYMLSMLHTVGPMKIITKDTFVWRARPCSPSSPLYLNTWMHYHTQPCLHPAFQCCMVHIEMLGHWGCYVRTSYLASAFSTRVWGVMCVLNFSAWHLCIARDLLANRFSDLDGWKVYWVRSYRLHSSWKSIFKMASSFASWPWSCFQMNPCGRRSTTWTSQSSRYW